MNNKRHKPSCDKQLVSTEPKFTCPYDNIQCSYLQSNAFFHFFMSNCSICAESKFFKRVKSYIRQWKSTIQNDTRFLKETHRINCQKFLMLSYQMSLNDKYSLQEQKETVSQSFQFLIHGWRRFTLNMFKNLELTNLLEGDILSRSNIFSG